MKALVTGAAGFIGSSLADSLTARGVDVVGLDCFTDYYARDIKERNLEPLRARRNFRFVEALLQDVALAPLLEGVTHVFHLAAQAGVRGSWGAQFATYTSHNVEATQRLLGRSRAGRSSAWSMRPVRPSTATLPPSRCGRTHGSSPYRRTG